MVKKNTIFAAKEIIPLFLILLMLAVAVGLSKAPCLPDKLPTHWNAAGEIDGYSGKTFALFFAPALTLAVYLLMLFVPLIDPFRANYEKFEKPYYFLRLSLVIFFFLLYFYTILVPLGLRVNIVYFIVPLFSLLFLVIGLIAPKIKRNYFLGFRTPWALQSDDVWDKTHRFGGKAMVIAAVLSSFSIFFGVWAFWIFLTIVLLGTFAPCIYSYFLYRKMGLFNKKS